MVYGKRPNYQRSLARSIMTANSFFRELKRLILSQPKPHLYIWKAENCELSNHVYFSKDLLNCFDCSNCNQSIYLYDSYLCANCFDCDYAVESQLCYESSDPYKCFNCEYLQDCAKMRDSSYSYACVNCHDVFGCVHLKNKSFCIFNRQLTEEEYRQQIKKFKTWLPEKVLKIVEELKKRFPWTQTNAIGNENTTYGNFIWYNKNCYLCFDASYNENCGYLYDSHYNKNCYDTTYSGKDNQLCYESVDNDTLFNCDFMVYSDHSRDSAYCFNCDGLRKCLGCVGLEQKQYCILNRQLTKEEYEEKSQQILLELKKANLGWNDLIF